MCKVHCERFVAGECMCIGFIACLCRTVAHSVGRRFARGMHMHAKIRQCPLLYMIYLYLYIYIHQHQNVIGIVLAHTQYVCLLCATWIFSAHILYYYWYSCNPSGENACAARPRQSTYFWDRSIVMYYSTCSKSTGSGVSMNLSIYNIDAHRLCSLGMLALSTCPTQILFFSLLLVCYNIRNTICIL